MTLALAIYFLNMFPQTRETKAKVNRCDHMKLKGKERFAQRRKPFFKKKKQPTEWEKLFEKDIFK